MGRQLLRSAVIVLSKFNYDSRHDDIEKSLLVIIQMIAEAVRFHEIRDFLTQNYEASAKLPLNLVKCQNDWAKKGRGVFHDACGIKVTESYQKIEVKKDERPKEIAVAKYPNNGYFKQANLRLKVT